MLVRVNLAIKNRSTQTDNQMLNYLFLNNIVANNSRKKQSPVELFFSWTKKLFLISVDLVRYKETMEN